MRKITRAIHFDFHNMPDLPDLGDDFNAEAFVKTLVESKVGYINFFARCNQGFSYYPTKIGIKHPYLKGRDIFGELLKECHKYDIGVTAYFNAGLSHAMSTEHRDWLTINREGKVFFGDKTGNDFRTMCFNTGYGDHLEAEVKELLEMYPDVDGIFLDCFSYPQPCFCTECVRLMNKENVDIENYEEVVRFNERKKMRMAERMRSVVPDDKYFFVNGAVETGAAFRGFPDFVTHAEVECLPTGGWGYESFPASAAYLRNKFEKRVYMTGRFRTGWGDFGGLREKADLEFDAYSALANTFDISIGDHLPPRGLPEKALFDIVKEIYTDVEKIEQWTQNAEYVPEIAVLAPDGEWYIDVIKESPLCDEQNCGVAVFAVRGAVRMLAELKYQFDVISEHNDFDKFKLIIVPDCMLLTDEVAKKLSVYLENGGKVISSGTSCLKKDKSGFASPEWNFLYEGKAPYETVYFKTKEAISEDVYDMPIAAYTSSIAVAAGEDNEVLAELWDPYFDKHWNGQYGFYYRPYANKNEKYSAILQHKNVIHISFKLFRSQTENSYPVFRKVFKNCIKRLYDDKIVETDAQVFVRTSLTKKDNLLMLHVLSYIPEIKGSFTVGVIDEGVKIYDSNFSIKWEKCPKKAYFVPDMEEIKFEYSNGRITLCIPKVDGHAIIAFEF